MKNNTHKGSELRNVSDTWDQNEKQRVNASDTGNIENSFEDDARSEDLERIIKQEAAEYDHDNKESRLLSGDRASINDTDPAAENE